VNTTCLAIIPARGGSKAIPRKNVHLLAGKPLIAYTIENARHVQGISRIVVSTDDSEIARISRELGAEVVMRSAEISGDLSSSESALLHTMEFLEKSEGYKADQLVFLQCTSPLTLPEDIERTIQALNEQNADCALTVTAFRHFLWEKDETGQALGVGHDPCRRLMRQEISPQYLETGAVYVMKTEGFLKARHRFFGRIALHEIPAERSLEIDEPEDLRHAEFYLRERQADKIEKRLPRPISAIVFDFDGVFTDNRVLVNQDGRESVTCNRADGLGISLAKRYGVEMLVLSSEKNPVVAARCGKLGIPCISGAPDKLAVLIRWCADRRIDISKVVYVGNDSNDLACMKAVGCPVAVRDAEPCAQEASSILLSRAGGQGAVREIIDLIVRQSEKE